MPDVPLLFATRMIRLFAYGLTSVILVLYLKEVGLGDGEIGLLLTLTLVGDTALSLWITTLADRVGRKRMLMAGAALMMLGGVIFAITGHFLPLLLAATIGVISPSGNEVGPFLAIEQAALAQIVAAEQRTRLFAWYHLAGALATAAGCLASGMLVQSLQTRGLQAVQSYRMVFFGYFAAGIILGILFVFLSPAAEVPADQIRSPSQRLAGSFLSLHRSSGVVLRLSALFALDAFGGGFVVQSLVAYWFYIKFQTDPKTLGQIFFGANVLAGFSALAAAALAQRIGLVNTMVFTHMPSNVLLILVPFMPTQEWAITVLLVRFAISQMDVPARQSYTTAVVDPDERSAAAGVTGVARTTGAALAPVCASPLLASPELGGVLFISAGFLKLLYDGLLYRLFRKHLPPEEVAKTKN
jgi:MFS family permease